MALPESSVTYSAYDPAIGVRKPPLKTINCISYNGSYWLAGGQETRGGISGIVYTDVNSLRNEYRRYKQLAERTRLDRILRIKGGLSVDNNYYNTLYTFYLNLATSFKDQLDLKISEKSTAIASSDTYTMLISHDGLSWTRIEDNPFNNKLVTDANYLSTSSSSYCNSISWNGSYWVAVGFDSGDTIVTGIGNIRSHIATSTDGLTWTRRGVADVTLNRDRKCYAVATSGSKWIVVGQNFQSFPITTNGTTITYPGCIAGSTDGINWTPVSSGELTLGRCIAYNGALWVTGGDRCILTSSDNGITWSKRVTLSSTQTCACVAWNGNYWLACGGRVDAYDQNLTGLYGGFVLKSEDGNVWESTEYDFSFKTIAWDGNRWTAGGMNGLYISSDGVSWERKTTENINSRLSEINAVVNKIPLPILGGTINTVTSLIAGYGAPTSVLRTYDNVKWLSQKIENNGFNFITLPQKEWNDVLWTGTQWVLVGEPDSDLFNIKTIATSSNGFEWTYPTIPTTSPLVPYSLTSVANNGSTILTVGTTSKLFSSTNNGITWTYQNISIETPLSIAWNGSYWLIGGVGGILKSTNGSSWTPATVCPLTVVHKIAWNGYFWLAGGIGSTSIIISLNGVHWFSVASTPFTKCNSIAWNRSRWVAVGEGDNTIATSVDGFTWTGLGNDIFLTSGISVFWTGAKWIATGSGYYTTAESSDGVTWTIFNTSIIRGSSGFSSNITLPYTGVANNNILTSINIVIATLTNDTNTILALEAEQAAIAADEELAAAAAAAAAALRLATENTASEYRMKILFWKRRINFENSIYAHFKNLKTSLNIETQYPYEYVISNSLNQAINFYHSKLADLYTEILDNENSQDILNEKLQTLESYITDIESSLVDYYNKTSFLTRQMLTAIYSNLTTTEFETNLDAYGFANETQMQNVLEFYNTHKDQLLTSIDTINNQLDDIISNVSYSIDVLDYNYSSQVEEGEILDLSQVTITSRDFLNKSLTDSVSKVVPIQSGGVGVRTINFVIGDIIKTSAPNIYSTYNTLTTVDLDTENPSDYTSLYTLNAVYKVLIFPVKTICDDYVEVAVQNNALWGAPISEQAVRDSFSEYYTEFFYTIDSVFFVPTVTKLSFAERYFKVKSEYYTSVAAYPSVLTTLSNSLTSTISSIDSAKTTAINYAVNKKQTTIKTKLQEFSTDLSIISLVKYTQPLELDEYMLDIANNTFYTTSKLEVAKKLKNLLKIGGDLYSQLYTLIFDVKYADIDAEYDGASPPKNGWGTSTNGLTGSDIGGPGLSGWEKYNDTIFTRQKLANFIRTRTSINKFVSYEGVGESVLWTDFLSFTANYTYNKIIQEKTDIEDFVEEATSNSLLTTGYIDSIVSSDISAIDAYYPTQAELIIDSIKNSVVTNLPSNTDLATYGGLKTSTSDTLQTYVNNINSIYNDLETLSETDLSTKTKNEIITLITTARTYRNSINAIQNSVVYRSLFDGIQIYKDRLAAATQYVSMVEDRINRCVALKNKYITALPFNVDEEIADGIGRSFIAGIEPTVSRYWTQRTHPVVFYNNQKIELTTPLPALNSLDYPIYSNILEYSKNEIVVYNSLMYQCIETGQFDGDTSLTIKGILPTNQTFWKQRVYPTIIYEGNEVEAVPSLATELNYLHFSYFDRNWLYYVGDMVAYNGNIYECTETLPELSLTSKIEGILPTNQNYWQQYSTQLSGYNINSWNEDLIYVSSTVVEHDGYIYKCEQTTIEKGLIPSENPVNWRRLSASEAQIPDEYSPSNEYSINNIVSYRSFNSTLNRNQLVIYICFRIDTETPQLYTYPTYVISDELDIDGNYIIQKETNGNHRSFYTQRYSPSGNKEDPFRVIGLARAMRQRVALYVELPYYWAFNLSTTAANDIATTYNLSLLNAKLNNTTEVHNGFVSRINTALTNFSNNQTAVPIVNVFKNVYLSLIEILKVLLRQVIALRAAVNRKKTQYFFMPYTQTRIYNEPYKFINVAVAAESGVKQFRDLGVGNLSEITADLEDGETSPALEYYNEHQPIIDDLEADIYDKKLLAETVIGYDTLFRTTNSTRKLGSLIVCESTGPLGILTPIVDYQVESFYLFPDEILQPILWHVNEIIKESTRPPEYVTDTNLSTALTYESTNPIVIGLGRVARGLVGLSAAAFQAYVPDPFSIFGILNFVSGGSIPQPLSVSWPSFREVSANRDIYHEQVNLIRDRYTEEASGDTLDGLERLMIDLGALLIYYSELQVDFEVNYKPVKQTFSYTSQVPEIPPPTYVPPKPVNVDIPTPARVDFTSAITSEISKVQDDLNILNQRREILLGRKPKPPIPIDIPSVSNEAVISATANIPPRKHALVNCNYNRNGIPIKAGVTTWDGKMPNKPLPEKALNTSKPKVTSADVDAALERKNLIEAQYNNAVEEWEKQVYELDNQRVARTTQLNDLNEDLRAARIEEQYTNARNQSETIRAREEALMKGLEDERTARFEYHRAQAAHNLAVQDAKNATTDSLIQTTRSQVESRGLKVTETRVTYEGKTATVVILAEEFEDAVNNNTGFVTWLNSKIPQPFRARYAAVISRMAPLFRFIRRAQVYIATRPPVRFAANVARNPYTRATMGAAGVLLQVGAVGLIAWQDGAFED